MNVKIAVATHKQYQMPADDIYLPVYAGAELKKDKPVPEGFVPDNTGENISELNPYFCELTGLFWAWKNLDADYIGLAHYRRHFSFAKKGEFDSLLTGEELKPYLGKIKVFTPNRRRYYIETLYSHYSHTFDSVHLDKAEEIIGEKYPGYAESFRRAVSRRSGYMFNMMIMNRELMNEYCGWLFDILNELRNRIDESDMNAFQLRYPGRVSEILFNVWLDYQLTSGRIKKGETKEIPVVSIEKVDWIKKGTSFLKAKFFGKKYNKSF